MRGPRATVSKGGREAALDARGSRTVGMLLIITGVTCAISAVTADEPYLYAVAGIAEYAGLRCWLSAQNA